MSYLVASFYCFADLPDCAALREPLLRCCQDHGTRGLVLLASEGLNGTIVGGEHGVQAVLAHLRAAHPAFADLTARQAWSERTAFHRMRVQVRSEIVNLGIPGLSPRRGVGQYLSPAAWNDLLRQPDLLLIDTRNDYEVALGSFEGALDPGIRRFSDLPGWLERHPALQGTQARTRPVAMFCTGGIRCEKSTALLRQQGFEQVYHLQGGILNYLQSVPAAESHWRGQCFVFDERVSVGPGLLPGPHRLCRACRMPLPAGAEQSVHYEPGVSCPRCHDHTSDRQKAAARSRQRQWERAQTARQGGG
ncbi:MAG: rhodanese-related sulfurtransferase [Rhodoferax sp.]|nr:rhodanese-related sulfurtransferase [Rhodoferax sp.]